MLCRAVVHDAVSVRVSRPFAFVEKSAPPKLVGLPVPPLKLTTGNAPLVPGDTLKAELLIPALELRDLLGGVVMNLCHTVHMAWRFLFYPSDAIRSKLPLGIQPFSQDNAYGHRVKARFRGSRDAEYCG